MNKAKPQMISIVNWKNFFFSIYYSKDERMKSEILLDERQKFNKTKIQNLRNNGTLTITKFSK